MKKKQILVVEDERIVADDVRMSLERLGYEVSGTAVSGEEAIEKAKKFRPDLVLMDIVLEGKMDGIKATSVIRSRFNIPVVYLTAYADERTLERAKITEPYGYILKPFDDRDLHTIIEIALYKHKMGNILKESEERYRSLVDSAHDAIYILTSGGFQYVNPAFERLSGRKRDEICSQQFSFLNIIHPDDRKLIKEKEKTKKRETEAPKYKFRIISKDGEVKLVEANTVLIGKNEGAKEIGILRVITEPQKEKIKSQQSSERLQTALGETVNALASALQRRDPYFAGHQHQVANLARAIAKEMDLPDEQIEAVYLAGTIHDIGKISIPADILNKPSPLSNVEMEIIKNHTQVSHDILKEISFPWPVAEIVLQHHERMDGSGYPAGLSGDRITIEARILALSDVIVAMSSSRPYRPAFSMDEILEEISKNKGALYDPKAVDAFLKLHSEKPFQFE
jgi:PAS domain S-box-containing protein/putative nucleotidyltransferase with HDIG domain